MKNLKLVLLTILCSGLVFTSCTNTNIDPIADDNSAFVDFISLATTADGSYTHKDKKCNVTEVDVAKLPVAITNYISTKYVGSKITRAGQTDSLKYIVHVVKVDSAHVNLIFDKNGVFLTEKSGKGKGGDRGVKIETSALSSSITSYISKNYAGSTIDVAFKTTEGKFGVIVIKADNSKIMLGFDAAGVFLNVLDLKDKKGENHKGPGKGPKKG
jgi:Putative beta-lactamase-inhibitor-like, PepSY-like